MSAVIRFSFGFWRSAPASTARQRTSETPASIIVENWRQKIDSSVSLTPPAAAARAFSPGLGRLRLLDARLTVNPCSRSCRARTLWFSASDVPSASYPQRSRTVYWNSRHRLSLLVDRFSRSVG